MAAMLVHRTKEKKLVWELDSIGHFEKYHNTLSLSPQILHKHCFQFLLGITKAPRENKNNAYAKFGGTNKEYYGIFRSGLYHEPVIIPNAPSNHAIF